jgi:HK97 gp10 family phage protein
VADTIRIELQGDQELLNKLAGLGISTKAILEAAVSAGATIVRDIAREQAPGPEIEMEVSRSSEESATALVGPDKEHWYYRFHETGAGSHPEAGKPVLVFEGESGTVRTKAVDHPGMAAKPFLRPAVDGHEEEAANAMGAKFRTAIEAVT